MSDYRVLHCRRGPLWAFEDPSYESVLPEPFIVGYYDTSEDKSPEQRAADAVERAARQELFAISSHESDLSQGRFARYCPDVLPIDCSIEQAWCWWHEQSRFINAAITAASEIDRPWSFRYVKLHDAAHYTFGFLSTRDAVEFKLRLP